MAAQRSALWLDALGFVPAYTAFLSLAAWAVAGRTGWPIVVALLIAGTADEIEGVLLFGILADLPGTQPLLDALFWIVRLKFLLLGLSTLAIGVLLVLTFRRVAVGWGLTISVGATYALFGFFDLPRPGMMLGFSVAWAALLFLAAFASLVPSLVSRERAALPPTRGDPNA